MDDLKKLPFEELMAQLERLVASMEDGKTPLEEMLKNFEYGSKLVKECRNRLNAFSKKVEVLSKDDGASGEWRDFQEGATRSASSPSTDDVPPEPELF